MKRAHNVLELIGATPMVRLSRVVEEDSAEVWGKLEATNPGGSVKGPHRSGDDRSCGRGGAAGQGWHDY